MTRIELPLQGVRQFVSEPFERIALRSTAAAERRRCRRAHTGHLGWWAIPSRRARSPRNPLCAAFVDLRALARSFRCRGLREFLSKHLDRIPGGGLRNPDVTWVAARGVAAPQRALSATGLGQRVRWRRGQDVVAAEPRRAPRENRFQPSPRVWPGQPVVSTSSARRTADIWPRPRSIESDWARTTSDPTVRAARRAWSSRKARSPRKPLCKRGFVDLRVLAQNFRCRGVREFLFK